MKKNKIFTVIEITVVALFLLLFVGCIVTELAQPEWAVSVWMKENVWDVNEALISLKSHVPVIINSLIYIVLVYAVCRVIRMIFSAKMKKDSKTKTVPDCRMIIKGMVYDVLLIDNPDEMDEQLEIYLRKVGAWNVGQV